MILLLAKFPPKLGHKVMILNHQRKWTQFQRSQLITTNYERKISTTSKRKRKQARPRVERACDDDFRESCGKPQPRWREFSWKFYEIEFSTWVNFSRLTSDVNFFSQAYFRRAFFRYFFRRYLAKHKKFLVERTLYAFQSKFFCVFVHFPNFFCVTKRAIDTRNQEHPTVSSTEHCY